MKTITDYSILCSEVKTYFSTKCNKPLLIWFDRSARLSNAQLDKFKRDIRRKNEWGISDENIFHRYINQMEEVFLMDVLKSFQDNRKPTLLLANKYEYYNKPCWVDESFDQICFDPVLTVALVSCVKTKTETKGRIPASQLYSSPLFKRAWAYAARVDFDDRFILSDKYGLLEGNSLVESYEDTLERQTPQARQLWANGVFGDLMQKGFSLDADCFVFFTGKRYRKLLIGNGKITNACEIYAVNRLRGIGDILHFLSV